MQIINVCKRRFEFLNAAGHLANQVKNDTEAFTLFRNWLIQLFYEVFNYEADKLGKDSILYRARIMMTHKGTYLAKRLAIDFAEKKPENVYFAGIGTHPKYDSMMRFPGYYDLFKLELKDLTFQRNGKRIYEADNDKFMQFRGCSI